MPFDAISARIFRRAATGKDARNNDGVSQVWGTRLPELLLNKHCLVDDSCRNFSVGEFARTIQAPSPPSEATHPSYPHSKGVPMPNENNLHFTNPQMLEPESYWGKSSNPAVSGILGTNSGGGPGTTGSSDQGDGMQARTASSGHNAIFARNDATSAVPPNTPGGNGVFGLSSVPGASGVYGLNNKNGFGVAGESREGVGILGRGRVAGRFEGIVEVTEDVRLTGADCAEDFDIAEPDGITPGTVMVIENEGVLRQSDQPYDKRVAGVISGAGGLRPAIIMDQQKSGKQRRPLALVGKVYCKVDARYGAIQVGDLLTTSATPGHAMKTVDSVKAFGAVIGKALSSWDLGRGLIPILIALQ